MNDLLTKTAEFFLIPEAALSTVFLFLFIIIFAFGVYRVQTCKKFLTAFSENAEEEFEKLRAKMSPDLFIKNNLRKISPTEDNVAEMPNIFVSVGIIATFLGLGVAIQGAADLLQTDKLELPKLTAVLGVIAFKFQTSVWGICFSILFRSLIVERYFDFRREIVDEVYERLYHLEHEGIRTLIEKQNEFLSEHLDWQKNFEEERLSRSNSQHEEFVAAIKIQHTELLAENKLQAQNLIDRLGTFENNLKANHLDTFNLVKYLVDNFNDFVKVAKEFAQNERDFSTSVKEFSANVTKFQTEFSALLKTELADLRNINESLMQAQTEYIEKIKNEQRSNIFHTTEELDKLHQKFYLDAKRFIDETQNAFSEIVEKTVNTVHDEYTREAYEIRNAVDEFRRTLSDIKENVSNINLEFLDEQKKFISSWNTVTNRITDTLNDLSAASAEQSQHFENTNKNVALIVNELRKSNSESLEHMRGILSDNAENLNMLHADFVKFTEKFMADITAAHKKGLSEISAQSTVITDSTKSLQENFSQVADDTKNVSENLNAEIISLKSALQKLIIAVDANQKSIDYNKEHLPKLLTQQERLTSALEKLNERAAATYSAPDSTSNFRALPKGASQNLNAKK